MTQEDKELLLKDLCARLPYGVKVQNNNEVCILGELDCEELTGGIKHIDGHYSGADIEEIKPYLRPMSSMTEEEEKELQKINCQFYKCEGGGCFVAAADDGGCSILEMGQILAYLNRKHFDYCGLIEKGLAIEVTEENNPYK